MSVLQLSEQEIATVRTQQYTFYRPAASKTNVPWRALAAIHFRENNLSLKQPTTPGGVLQFDPVPGKSALENLLKLYSNLTPQEQVECAIKNVSDLMSSFIIAGCILKRNCRFKLIATSPDEQVLDAFYGYNGRVGKSPYDSAYCVNGLDAQHNNLVIIGSEPNGHGGRTPIRVVDHRPGAFVVFQQLAEMDTPIPSSK